MRELEFNFLTNQIQDQARRSGEGNEALIFAFVPYILQPQRVRLSLHPVKYVCKEIRIRFYALCSKVNLQKGLH